MLSLIISKILGSFGLNFTDRVLEHLERKANTEVERQKVQAAREATSQANAVKVVTTGMQYKVFWIPWLIAAIPTSLWIGLGMLDSATNGLTPDVAELPPQLLRYADIVIGNIFYAGAGMGTAHVIANSLRK